MVISTYYGGIKTYEDEESIAEVLFPEDSGFVDIPVLYGIREKVRGVKPHREDNILRRRR